MRSSGLEPPRGVNPTRPSTLRVYQFRHEREAAEYSPHPWPARCPGHGREALVAAGQPMLAEENIEDYVAVPEVAGGADGQYLLRIRGDSMKDAGILEDDYVVVRPQETADDGDIVVALLGEEATVKRFFKESDH